MFEVQKCGIAECLLGAVLWPLLFQTRESSPSQSQGKSEMHFSFQSSRQTVSGKAAEPRAVKLLGSATPLSKPDSEEGSCVLLTLKKGSASLCLLYKCCKN